MRKCRKELCAYWFQDLLVIDARLVNLSKICKIIEFLTNSNFCYINLYILYLFQVISVIQHSFYIYRKTKGTLWKSDPLFNQPSNFPSSGSLQRHLLNFYNCSCDFKLHLHVSFFSGGWGVASPHHKRASLLDNTLNQKQAFILHFAQDFLFQCNWLS